MKKIRLVMLSFLALSLFTLNCSDDDSTSADTDLNIVEVASTNSNFSTLVQALGDANLAAALQAEGPFTVFAPTNEAFGNLPAGLLESLTTEQLSIILQYHVLEGEVASSDLAATQAPETLTGESVYVTVGEGAVRVNSNSLVSLANIPASNGIIHAITEVLLPNQFLNIVQIASKNYELTTLVSLLASNNLVGTLEGTGPFTVFAPTNEALADAAAILDTLTPEQVQDVLEYHVATGKALSGSLNDGDVIPTIQGENITVSIDNEGNVTLNGSINVITVDLEGTNGVIHIIDGALVPPSFTSQTSSVTTIDINNAGSSAWQFTSIDGENATASLNSDNADITLTTGNRYTFNNNGGSSHPLEFRDASGNALLTEDSSEGSYESDSNVDFQVNGSEISFTLTEQLASDIVSYYCTIHSVMNGGVTVN